VRQGGSASVRAPRSNDVGGELAPVQIKPWPERWQNRHEDGGHLRRLCNPIDTAGLSGMLVLQIMGAIAQFEPALAVERTKAGLPAARAQGRVGGNPTLRSRHPAVLGRIVAAREQTRLAVVRRLRPARPWDEVTEAVSRCRNSGMPSSVTSTTCRFQENENATRIVRLAPRIVRHSRAERQLWQRQRSVKDGP